MKTLAMEDAVPEVRQIGGQAQVEPVLLTRDGKPVACVFGLRNRDAEDFEYITDPAFWQMIRERRQDDSDLIPWEQVEADLAERERLEASAAPADRLMTDQAVDVQGNR